MRRTLSTAIVIVLSLAAPAAHAQYREGAVLLTVGAGSTFTKIEESGDQVTGGVGAFTLEKVLAGGRINAGFSLVWLSANDDVTLEGDTGTTPLSFSGTPFMLTGRYNLLNSRFAMNIGLGLGFQSSTLYLDEGTVDERKQSTTGMVLSIPVEAVYFLDPDFYLQAAYAPAFLTATTLSDDMAHTLALSVGFQWGATGK